MGISLQTVVFFKRLLRGDDSPEKLEICELGNQHLRAETGMDFAALSDGKWVDTLPAKVYAERLGHRHVSIDLNGKDGALQRDLRQPLLDLGEFDLVTNFGTSEHVTDQEACFQNIHNLCRLNGTMFHAVPLAGHWPGHPKCHVRYTPEFFQALARHNGYDVVDLQIVPHHKRPRHDVVIAELFKARPAVFTWSKLEVLPSGKARK